MIAYILIIFGLLMRLIPHVPNIAPIAAIAIFSGAILDKKIVPWVPLAIMVVSDLIMGMHNMVFYTWGSFIVIGYFGMRLKDKLTVLNIFSASLISAVFFFIVTNLGVWITSGMYPHTFQGFINCYFMALPFFRNTLIGNVVFSFFLFGSYELARRTLANSRLSKVLLVG